MVTDQVRPTATIGHPMTLAVTVAGASLSPAEAAVSTVVGQPGQGGPNPTTSPVPTLPPPAFVPIAGSTVTPEGLTGLFPTVTPRPSPTGKAARARRLAGVTQDSSALPLDPRLIGGQLAGLAVLAAAITMVVARLSLRTPQTAGAGAPAAPEPAAPEPTAPEPAAPVPTGAESAAGEPGKHSDTKDDKPAG
jgi:hypothetical protein